jgi:hypothetical protein
MLGAEYTRSAGWCVLEHTKQRLKSKGKKLDTQTQTQELVLQTPHPSFTS